MNDTPTLFDPTLLLLVGFMVLIYFLMIRPENKRRKAHQEMLASIEVGDEIVTSGGILGKVVKVKDQFLVVSVSDSVNLKVQNTSVASVLPKGTLKSI
tara:strand:- start:25 stop:318 length:294 start_codon:yes stop_codon:yes gene_type:complete